MWYCKVSVNCIEYFEKVYVFMFKFGCDLIFDDLM